MTIVLTYVVIAVLQVVAAILLALLFAAKGIWTVEGVERALYNIKDLLDARNWITYFDAKKPLSWIRTVATIVLFPIVVPAKIAIMWTDSLYDATVKEAESAE